MPADAAFFLKCPPPSKSNVGIVGLVWVNQHRRCIAGGEGKEDRKAICGQKCKDF